MTLTEIVADILVVVGFGLVIAALALVSLALALGVGGGMLLVAGTAMAALEAKKKRAKPRHSGTLTGHEP